MRVGIAGTGRIGTIHAATLAAHPDVHELVIYDPDQPRATKVATTVGGSIAPSIEELLAADLAGLVVATPTAAHAALVKAGADAGVAVFCEKPVAVDVGGTRDVLEHVTARGVPVQVGFQRRFDPGYVSLREALRGGELGELRRLHMVSADPAPPSATYIAGAGGIFRDLHIHDFDALRWVTERQVTEIFATGSNRGEFFFADANDVDECVAVLVLEDGTLATMQGSRYNGAGYDVRMEVAGTQSTRVVGLFDRSPFWSTEPGVTFPAGPPWVLFHERFKTAYADELQAFIDVAAGRRSSPCTVADALEAFYLAEAADLSLHERRPVRVDEVISSVGI